MLNQLLSTGTMLAQHQAGGHLTDEKAFSQDTTEVLPHCPYHPQIDFYHAARDAFLESQGLGDF